MISKLRKRMKGEKGFTLIELLVVIIIIAILAAIAIPTFLGQRQKAQDASAKSLCRNAMTAMESAYVDTQSFATVDAAALLAIEPAITWTATANEAAAAHPTGLIADGKHAYFFSANANTYGMGAVSASGKTFGVRVNKSGATVDGVAPGAAYYVGGVAKAW
jgi:type IV pilus assembly protein PilA